MSWSKGEPRDRGYHHGNLREALVEAALQLIAQKGPAGFTVAEAARLAGVSPAAPYRHFRDREDLLAEVSLQGFERFAQILATAWGSGGDPVHALEALGRAYLAFARTEPAYYAAMFEAGISASRNSALLASSDRAFAVLREAATAVSGLALPGPRPPALMIALHVWSLAHGIAALFGRADDGRRPLPMSPEELLEAGLLVYLQGLGIRRSP